MPVIREVEEGEGSSISCFGVGLRALKENLLNAIQGPNKERQYRWAFFFLKGEGLDVSIIIFVLI